MMDERDDNYNISGGSLSGFDADNDNSITEPTKSADAPLGSASVNADNGCTYHYVKSEIIKEPENNDKGKNSGYTTTIPIKTNNKKQPKAFSGKTVIAAVLAAAVIAGVVGAGVGAGTVAVVNRFVTKGQSAPTEQSNINNVTTIKVDKTASNIVEAVAEKVTPSVVGIRTTTSVENFFFGSSESTGEGSGIIYSKDGYVITNYHVIQEAVQYKNGKIEVFLADSTAEGIPATVIGYNISTDLAVIKIEKEGLVPVELGNSDDLKVGEFVVAIGNPGGLEYMSSVTYGIVSGLNRSVSSGYNNSKVEYIQTDAAINPGNSGGALVDSEGKLIGVNSVKIVSESYEGMGFSIPVNTAVEICEKIIAQKDAPEAYVGITISERYDGDTLRYLGYPVGAVVQNVKEDSPAAKAGIQRGDIITELNGNEVTDYTEYDSLLSDLSVGDKVNVKVYRAGRYYTVSLTVASENSAK